MGFYYINIPLFFECFSKNSKENSWTYQNQYRIYLDEYPEQKEERKDYFLKRWNLKNDSLHKFA